MKAIAGLAVFAAALTGSSAAIGADISGHCDLEGIKTVGELQSTLSRRAVEIVNLAAGAQNDANAKLEQMVASSATFSLGVGDVGRPLGVGLVGVHALAEDMKADTFHFLGWDYMPIPLSKDDACASRKVDIEFTDTHRKLVYPVSFTFEAGRLISAAGWSRSFETGPVERVRD